MTPATDLIDRLEYVAMPDQFGAVGPHAHLCREAAAALRALEARVGEMEAERAVLVKGVLAADTVCLFRDTGNDWRAFIEAKDLAQELRRWPVVAKEGK
jgi:hypothetical protein